MPSDAGKRIVSASRTGRLKLKNFLSRILHIFRTIVSDPRTARSKAALRMKMALLRLENRFSRRSVLGTTPVVVSLTTFGHRTKFAFYAVESVANGRIRPSSLILWIDEIEVIRNLPPELRRLQRRGLEIRHCENFGPHKKYYPFVSSVDRFVAPLVIIDDDTIYPRYWLAGLLDAHSAGADDVVGYRAHRVLVNAGGLAPYSEWLPQDDSGAAFDVFCTGGSGVLYPPHALAAIRSSGDSFLQLCPKADDVWLHAVCVRSGIKHRQVEGTQRHFDTIPQTQVNTLYRHNVKQGGNDAQIRATYHPADILAIETASRARSNSTVGSGSPT